MVNFIYLEPEEKLTCRFTGHLDTLVCQEISKQMNEYLEKLPPGGDPPMIEYNIVFDLGETTYISSTFIRICLQTAQKVKPGKFSITNCDPLIKKVFKIAGLNDALRVG
jgi:anti-anti-sigma factor